MNLHHSMHDGNISIFDFKDNNLSHANGVVLVVEKEDISSLEGGLHTARENHNYRGFGLGHKHKPLPYPTEIV